MSSKSSLLAGLRVGTDITRIHRFNFGGKQSRIRNLARKILHPLEIQSLQERSPKTYDYLFGTSGSQNDQGVYWLSGRWAAKEAAKKAWGASILGWKDVRVNTNAYAGAASGGVSVICQPVELYRDGTLEHETSPMQEGLLSISHDGEYAVATVVAEKLSDEMLAVIQRFQKPRASEAIEDTLDVLENKLPVDENKFRWVGSAGRQHKG